MKLSFFWYLLLLLGVVQGADDLHSALTSGECASCAESSEELVQCAADEGCDIEDCLKDDPTLEEMRECCGGCTDKYDAAVECFTDCLPECVNSTLFKYSVCAKTFQCETKCDAAIAEAAADADNTVVSAVSDGDSFDIDFDELQKELEDISTAELTCSFFEDEFEEDVCDLANCCGACIDLFEDVAECVINEVLFDQILDSDTTCDIECGDGISIGGNGPLAGRGGGRLLQPTPGDGPPGDGPPGNGPPGEMPAGSDNLPEPFAAFGDCQMVMAAYMAFGQTEGAYDAYMTCLLSSLGKFTDGPGTAPPTDAPTDDESSANIGTKSLMMSLPLGSIAILSAGLM